VLSDDTPSCCSPFAQWPNRDFCRVRIAASPASWHDGGGGTGAVIRDSCGPADVDVVAGAASAPPARVVAVDDHDLARAALRTVIAQDARMQLVGEARNGREAVNLVRQLQPDLVLMDVRMPDMDGLQATRLVKQDCPMTCVLILTMMDDVDLLLETVKAGAAGFVLKSASEAELRTAMWDALNGDLPVDPRLAREALLRLANEQPFRQHPPTSTGVLSPREMEVLPLVARGLTNREIADELVITQHTVKIHVEHILAKLEVSDRTQAAVRAIELGYIKTDS